MNFYEEHAPPRLPEGDIVFDGETIRVGGTELAPGQYLIGDAGVLHVFDQDQGDESE